MMVLSSRDNRRRMIMIDHVGGRRRRRLAPPGGRFRTAGHVILRSFNLKPCVSKCFGKVVINRSGDGYRVCHRLWLLVILPKASAEVFLHYWITGSGSCTGKARVGKEKGLVRMQQHLMLTPRVYKSLQLGSCSCTSKCPRLHIPCILKTKMATVLLMYSF